MCVFVWRSVSYLDTKLIIVSSNMKIFRGSLVPKAADCCSLQRVEVCLYTRCLPKHIMLGMLVDSRPP